MAKTILIVESENDKFTFEAIINYMALSENINVNSSEHYTEYKILSAENQQPNGLIENLKGLKNDFTKGKFSQVGIIWDLDTKTTEQRVEQIKTAITTAYKEAQMMLFDTINQFGTLLFKAGTKEEFEIKIACHFVGLQETGGEIEDILKKIKSKASPLADCIDTNLPHCLQELHKNQLRDKDLVKLWINNYQRYDTLDKDQRSSKFTTWENMMKRDIFDFGKDEVLELKNLKEFLMMMTL